MWDDCFPSHTSEEQNATERAVMECLGELGDREPSLHRDDHVSFLLSGLDRLPRQFSGLDASRPWFVYWISHSLDLLSAWDREVRGAAVRAFVDACWQATGGFGGGPHQLAHLAATFAAVSALTVSRQLDCIDRRGMQEFLMSLKDPTTGGFRMHANGSERDMRGTYCAVAVASLLGLLTPALTAGVAEYVWDGCADKELGGIAGDLGGLEAHGGYGYCGLATLGILSRELGVGWFRERRRGLLKMVEWLAMKQMDVEGGFCGRTNKLVDSCYTFWQGASLSILGDLLAWDSLDSPDEVVAAGVDIQRLRHYVLGACQGENGGLKDKPGKHCDFYHTCYALSGLAVLKADPQLQPTHPLYNVKPDHVAAAHAWAGSDAVEKLGKVGWA